ncbi:hypothetical protein [Photobacterium kagoshimensis]|uniref:hypothetical protein n=1 Tax=Photobacterium kagoshimensis TaxID=2910242 RepID=UPI003D134D3B
MSQYDLKDAISEHMPFIDELLQKMNVPIFNRYMRASYIFVDVAVIDSSFETKDELLKSKAFFEHIIPPINDWYWDKYGELAKNPTSRVFSGIVTPYGQPISVKIPATISSVEVPNETARLIFPDCLQENESMNSMLQIPVKWDKLTEEEKNDLSSEFHDVVSMTRSINLNIMSITGLDEETLNMARGIWSHFEKSILDILSFQNHQASIGCWELHLAIEKTLKVYLKQVSGNRPYGHDLNEISKKVKTYDPDLDLSIIPLLPSDKSAIKLRYSELVTNIGEAVEYYKRALVLVSQVTNKLSRKYCLNNASVLLKKAPWAK